MLDFSDIAAYDGQDSTFILNKQGIGRWDSFQSYSGEPSLSQSLYNRNFIIKIDGVEIARGKFWSFLSSMSLKGLAIMDSMFEMDQDKNKLRLISEYPAGSPGSEYTGLNQELIEVFKSTGT